MFAFVVLQRQDLAGKHAAKMSPIPSSAVASSDLALLADALQHNDVEVSAVEVLFNCRDDLLAIMDRAG